MCSCGGDLLFQGSSLCSQLRRVKDPGAYDRHRLRSPLCSESHCSLTDGSIGCDRRPRKTKVPIATTVTTIAPAAAHHTFIALTIGARTIVEQPRCRPLIPERSRQDGGDLPPRVSRRTRATLNAQDRRILSTAGTGSRIALICEGANDGFEAT